MRQPQASSAAADMLAAKPAPTAEPSRMPPQAPQDVERAHQAAAAFRRVLDQEHHGAGIFAADRKPLHHPQQA